MHNKETGIICTLRISIKSPRRSSNWQTILSTGRDLLLLLLLLLLLFDNLKMSSFFLRISFKCYKISGSQRKRFLSILNVDFQSLQNFQLITFKNNKYTALDYLTSHFKKNTPIRINSQLTLTFCPHLTKTLSAYRSFHISTCSNSSSNDSISFDSVEQEQRSMNACYNKAQKG